MRSELITTLKRQTTELLSDLERNKEPILITQHGVQRVYLVDVETYEALQRRMNLLEGIVRGEKAVEEGRTLTHAQAKNRMNRWLKSFGPIWLIATWMVSSTTSPWTIRARPKSLSGTCFQAWGTLWIILRAVSSHRSKRAGGTDRSSSHRAENFIGKRVHAFFYCIL